MSAMRTEKLSTWADHLLLRVRGCRPNRTKRGDLEERESSAEKRGLAEQGRKRTNLSKKKKKNGKLQAPSETNAAKAKRKEP